VKDPEKLKEFILEKVDLAQVMLDYKVDFVFNPLKAEEAQFKCPFHGQDTKPSARYYRATQSCWCWACQKKWDVISFVMDKEGLWFNSALNFLVNRYRLDVSGISDTPEFKNPITQKISEESVLMAMLFNSIIECRKKIPLEKYRVIVSFFYKLSYEKSKGNDVSAGVQKLKEKIEKLQNN
jgi:hypothetical protein